MDKSSLLELILLSSRSASEGDYGGWVGSCDAKVSPPFGKMNITGVKAFNQRMLDDVFSEDASRGKVKAAIAARVSGRRVQKKRFSPLAAYRDHLTETKGDMVANALAYGTGSMLPGCTIGERIQNKGKGRLTRQLLSREHPLGETETASTKDDGKLRTRDLSQPKRRDVSR